MKNLIFLLGIMAINISQASDIKEQFGLVLGEKFDSSNKKFMSFSRRYPYIYNSDKYHYLKEGFEFNNFSLQLTIDKEIAVIYANLSLYDYKNFEDCRIKSEKLIESFSRENNLPAEIFYIEEEKFKSAHHTIRDGRYAIDVTCKDYSDALTVEIADTNLVSAIPDISLRPNIQGAFGFKFGDIFDLNKEGHAINKNFPSENIETIHIMDNVHEPFDEYILMVDPKTIEIHGIAAKRANSKECSILANDYEKAISEKYEILFKKNDGLTDGFTYSDDNVSISISCDYLKVKSRFDSPVFEIVYIDKKLYDKSRESYRLIDNERISKINKTLL